MNLKLNVWLSVFTQINIQSITENFKDIIFMPIKFRQKFAKSAEKFHTT